MEGQIGRKTPFCPSQKRDKLENVWMSLKPNRDKGTNWKMSLRNRSTMRFWSDRDKLEKTGTKPGTEFYIYSYIEFGKCP
jgi:hypothetical protein|nr:MAG TPA: hypothetical protein [Caudoviricetes sp.]